MPILPLFQANSGNLSWLCGPCEIIGSRFRDRICPLQSRRVTSLRLFRVHGYRQLLLLKKLNDLRVNGSSFGARYHVTRGWRLP